MTRSNEPDRHAHRADEPVQERMADRHDAVAREKEEFGGIKWGSAFFGWLTALGTAVLLIAILSAVGAAVGLGTFASTDEARSTADQNAETIGVAGGIGLVVLVFVAYYCGGYVAARMARFNGIRQGLAVWVWALLAAIVVAVVVAVAGNEYNVLSDLDGFPRIPIDEGDLTTGGIVTAAAAVVATLLGAVLGGLAGMRFHRRVDRAGLGR